MRRLLISLIVLFVLLLAACTDKKTEPAKAESSTSTTQAEQTAPRTDPADTGKPTDETSEQATGGAAETEPEQTSEPEKTEAGSSAVPTENGEGAGVADSTELIVDGDPEIGG